MNDFKFVSTQFERISTESIERTLSSGLSAVDLRETTRSLDVLKLLRKSQREKIIADLVVRVFVLARLVERK